MFRYIKLCEDAKNGNFRRPADPKIAANVVEDSQTTDLKIVEAVPTLVYKVKNAPIGRTTYPDDSPLSGYTHLRIAARIKPEEPNTEICLDPGASRSLIGRSFLKRLNHIVKHRKGRVKGVGEEMLNLSH